MTPQELVAHLSQWRDAKILEIDGGLTNRSWLVEASGNRAVLKIDEAPRAAPFNSRTAEARIQSAAADAGLAAPVLHVTDGAIMTGYVEGRVWTAADFDDDANLARLAAALRRLHGLPRAGRTFDARGAAEGYATRIVDTDPAAVQDRLRAVAAMPEPRELCCCHNDLVAENIIETPAIRFLDWEFACDNDPLFDLATVVAHHGLSDDGRDALLDAYFDADAARFRDRLDLFERGYRALLWLWLAARPEAELQHQPGGGGR